MFQIFLLTIGYSYGAGSQCLDSGLKYPPVIFFTEWETYKNSMDRWYFGIVDAYINASDGKSVLWGYGFDGYNNSLSLRNNIFMKFGSINYFTALMVFSKNDEEIREVSNDMIIIGKEWECFEERCVGHIEKYNYSILLTAYAKETAYLAYSSNANVNMIVHCPNAAPASMYVPVNHKDRTGGAVLCGAIYGNIYPLRKRFRKIIAARQLPRASVYRHVGQRISNALEQSEQFTKMLQSHKIALFDASIYNYQLQKFAEAAIAGALIISNVPDDDPEFWTKYIVPVDFRVSDGELIEIVNYWLDHDNERTKKAQVAQEAVLCKYTTDHTSQLIAKSIALYHSGFRGTKHDFPFTNSCSADSPVKKNKWCFN